MWQVVQHLAESGDESEEVRSALYSQHELDNQAWFMTYLEYGLLGMLCPMRIFLVRVELDVRLRAQLNQCFIELGVEDVHKEVV